MKLEKVVVTYYPKYEKIAKGICGHISKQYGLKPLSQNVELVKKPQEEQVDLVISVGGDGTFIKSASMFVTKMVLGIKVSGDSVGYHCASNKEEYRKHIKAVMDGKFSKKEYFGLETKAGGEVLPCAFNEVLLTPKNIGEMFNYSLDIDDGSFSGRSTALIIYTPAGSTAHAKSAGGAQLSLNLNAFGIVPESQFSGDIKNFIIPSDKKVSIKSRNEEGGIVIIDGWYKHGFSKGGKIQVSKGRKVEVIHFD